MKKVQWDDMDYTNQVITSNLQELNIKMGDLNNQINNSITDRDEIIRLSEQLKFINDKFIRIQEILDE